MENPLYYLDKLIESIKSVLQDEKHVDTRLWWGYLLRLAEAMKSHIINKEKCDEEYKRRRPSG
jgi:hypothetical protein